MIRSHLKWVSELIPGLQWLALKTKLIQSIFWRSNHEFKKGQEKWSPTIHFWVTFFLKKVSLFSILFGSKNVQGISEKCIIFPYNYTKFFHWLHKLINKHFPSGIWALAVSIFWKRNDSIYHLKELSSPYWQFYWRKCDAIIMETTQCVLY